MDEYQTPLFQTLHSLKFEYLETLSQSGPLNLYTTNIYETTLFILVFTLLFFCLIYIRVVICECDDMGNILIPQNVQKRKEL